jgi:16S rRNA (cytosine1402-N4)-methyltransferase
MGHHHTPALVDEVLTALQIAPGGRYIDCTVGEGGHSLAILEAVRPAPRVLGIDLDTQALAAAGERLKAHSGRVTLAQGNFANLSKLVADNGFLPADGVLIDLGLSSLQLESPERGFSFLREGRLDMRFDMDQEVSAHEVANYQTEQELAVTIYELGEEPKARRVAAAIVNARPVETTAELAGVVNKATGRGSRGRTHPATRTFQALRMSVNRELDNLQQGLKQAIDVLETERRMAVISYHSLEDRIVKNTFRTESSDCICPPRQPECTCGHVASIREVNRRVIKPTAEEVESNPRARSARLRVAERL